MEILVLWPNSISPISVLRQFAWKRIPFFSASILLLSFTFSLFHSHLVFSTFFFPAIHFLLSFQQAAVSVLRHLNLLEVAVMAEDSPPLGLLQAFSSQAQISGMQAIQLDSEPNNQQDDDDDIMDTLKLLSQYGKVCFSAFYASQSSDSLNFPKKCLTPNFIANNWQSGLAKAFFRRLWPNVVRAKNFSSDQVLFAWRCVTLAQRR